MAHARIAVGAFVRAEPARDGSGVTLVLVDEHGDTVVVSLGWDCLGALLCGLPGQPAPQAGAISDVQAWHLDVSGPGSALTLTLQTAEGRASAFRLTAGQLAGMATVALHTRRPAPSSRNMH